MRFFIFFILVMYAVPVFSQEGCKPSRAYKHEYHMPLLASEHGGVYLNAHTVDKKNLQLEMASLVSTFNELYDNEVFTNVFAARYGLGHVFEIHFRSSYISPSELNVDSLYNTSISLGLKTEALSIIRVSFEWKLSFSSNISLWSSTEHNNEMKTPLGADVSIENSFQYKKLLHFDLSLGAYSFYEVDQAVHGKISSRVLLKDRHSKIGIFLGIAGNQYFESIINIGLEISNNKNYILLLSIGALDKGAAPSVAYSYKF